MIRTNASAAQHQASNPASNVWLSANAGSGKTKVLIDRVARLLLSGVSPQHILCLTYTKAAATEMQNRLFKRLGEWAMMPETALRAALAELSETQGIDQAALAQARRLFARAVETPGGLRIQTIHSFCATLLRRFPLESGVSPAFQEMDDRAARLLRESILQDMAETWAQDQVQGLAQHFTGADFMGLMAQIAGQSDAFSGAISETHLKRALSVPDNLTEDGLLAQVFLGDEADLIAQLLPFLLAGSTNDLKDARKLARIDWSQRDSSLLEQLEDVFLYGSGKSAFSARLERFPTGPTRRSLHPKLSQQLDDFMRRIEVARPLRIGLAAVQKSAALHGFANAYLPAYEMAKADRALLDFDDLIDRAIGLLTDRSVAAWVLYRLDGGIDHILVDEAQDTSPKQWRVIELLAEEFSAGHSAAQRARSLFVVGDKKQSIYSFQGADVAVFDQKRAAFAGRFAAANLHLEQRELQHSFRSSPAILRVVDDTFATRFPRALGDTVQHLAHHSGMPGRCDLWPAILPAETADQIDPTETAAQLSADSALAELAGQIAAHIDETLRCATPIATKDGPARVRAGDILILVRKRTGIFPHIIRACKRLGLPIAGADRLRLGGEIAVRDLTTLLQFLATPEDDLALAGVLRAPLFGLSEADIFDLAHGRSGYLWAALRDGARHAEAKAVLTDLRDSADFLRPYEMLERILTRHDGRRKLIARLGAEAEEGIDEMLSQALIYEQGEVPSLTGFLLWLEADDITVKRQVDSGGGLIRVMTVHGAKGLEAPIVYLPECADTSYRDQDEIIALPDGTPLWRTNADESPAAMTAAKAARREADLDENLRLLYVGMTRAQSWLIVAAAGKINDAQNWYNLVAQGMAAAGAVAIKGGIQRYEFGLWPDTADAPPSAPADTPLLPDWALQRAEAVQSAPAPFAPSRLAGAKTVGGLGEGDPAAMALGSAVHLLLETLPDLPQADWTDVAARLTPDHAAPALAEASRLLLDPALQAVFAGMAEVGITAPSEKGRMLGYIDRLIVSDTTVLAVDFKTNAVVPATPAEVPEGLLAQMGAYLDGLARIYPNRAIQIAILWTKTAQLMPLDHDMMRAAFRRAAIS